MKIMKNRKLFGLLKPLDIIIIVLILVIVLPMLHYYIKFNEKGIAEQKLLNRFIKRQTRYAVGFQTGPFEGTLDVRVSFKNLTKEDLDRIKLHDKEILPDGTVLAEILWLGSPQSNYFIVDLGKDNEKILRETIKTNLYSLPAKLRIKGIIKDTGNFFYKARSMKKLNHFIFKTDKYEVDFVNEEGI